MILFDIYLLLFVIVAMALAAVYFLFWRPLQRVKAEREAHQRKVEEIRQREADLEARLRVTAVTELEKECGPPLQAHLGDISNSEQDQ